MFSISIDETVSKLGTDDLYATSDASIWAALRSHNIFPIKVELTDTAVRVYYRTPQVMALIPDISSGFADIDELDAHGTTVLWKAVIGFMKMLSRYEVDKSVSDSEESYAYTTDQYLIWAAAFRKIYPSRVTHRGRDAAFVYTEEQIEELKSFLFFSYAGKMSDYTSMRGVWKQAKTFRVG